LVASALWWLQRLVTGYRVLSVLSCVPGAS
jgi:hypothetical protein